MTVTIRNAVDADLDPLVGLNAQVQELHAQVYPADFKSLTDEGEVRDFLASVMRQTDHTILLAQVDGVIVGYAWFGNPGPAADAIHLGKEKGLSASYLRRFRPSAIGRRFGPHNPD